AALLAIMLGWLGVYALLERANRREHRLTVDLQAQSLALVEAQRMGNIGHWELDVGANRLHASDEALRLLDRGMRHLDGGPAALFARVHDEDQARLLGEMEQAAQQGGRGIDVELRVVAADGSARTVQMRGERTVDAQGRLQLTGTVQDVSKWARA